MTLKLSGIVDAMEMQIEESSVYFDRTTGDFVINFDGEVSHDIDPEELENEERFAIIPDKFDIHDYEIMERFARHAVGIPGDDLRNSLHGSGAFRYFRDTLQRHGMEDEWYAYREQEYAKIAKSWCDENKIPYEDDLKPAKPAAHKNSPNDDNIDWDKVDDAALALMHLSMIGGRTWKSFDWGITDRLHKKGYIDNPRSKSKSVGVSVEGEELAEKLFHKLFRKED